jgi:GDSL-like Lipase/Acylhydrolase family
MGHVVLLGDSIFDNARYVPDRPPVIEQLRRALPAGWQATLLAIDGHMTGDVDHQLNALPDDASHLFVSCGGNDALGQSPILLEPAATVGDSLHRLHEVRTSFRTGYRKMLAALSALAKPAAVCTIYDLIPRLEPAARTALAIYNEVILHEAFLAGLPVIDLRLVCNHPGDYSPLSPIEPSVVGGSKIARVIAEVATTHDFTQKRSVVYWY